MRIEDLKLAPVWVCRNKDKAPINPKTGGGAMSNNPETWANYETAAMANFTRKGPGVGFMLPNPSAGIVDGCLVFIDLDGPKDENGNHTGGPELPEQLEIISMLTGKTYCEKSMNGGLHFYGLVNPEQLPEGYPEGFYQKKPDIDTECYIGGHANRYAAYTGKQQGSCDSLNDITLEVNTLLTLYMKKAQEQPRKAQERQLPTRPLTLDDILDKARNAANGAEFSALYDQGDTSKYGGDDSAADLALCNMLAFWYCKSETAIDEAFRKSALMRDKWNRDDYRTATIQRAIADQREVYNPDYHTSTPSGDTGSQRMGRGRPSKPEITLEEMRAFCKEMGYSFRLNTISHEIEFKGFKELQLDTVANNAPTKLYDKIKTDGRWKAPKQVVIDYISYIANVDRFNPVLEMINGSEPWDGVNRWPELYEILVGVSGDSLSETLVRKWFYQGYALANNNGVPFGADGILVLQGAQGIGKTTFARKAAVLPELFKDSLRLGNNDKDLLMQCTKYWIGELGEIDTTFKRADIGYLKGFITQDTDEYRPPYGRGAVKYNRRTSFIGTVNESEFLVDTTGNRRFWTIPLDDVDLDKLQQFDFRQLWRQVQAEIQVELDKGRRISEVFRLTKDELKQLETRNGAHEIPMKGQPEIEDTISKALAELNSPEASRHYTWEYMTVTDFLQGNNLRVDTRQAGRILRKLGYNPTSKRVNKIPVQAYKLPILRAYSWEPTTTTNY